MAIFVIILFVLLLTVLPLQWLPPLNGLSSTVRESWNGPSIVLYCVSGFFYLAIFIQKKRWLNPTVIRNCFIAAALIISWWLIAGATEAGAREVARLLSVIWTIPLMNFVHKQLGTQRLLYLLAAVTVIHAQ